MLYLNLIYELKYDSKNGTDKLHPFFSLDEDAHEAYIVRMIIIMGG